MCIRKIKTKNRFGHNIFWKMYTQIQPNYVNKLSKSNLILLKGVCKPLSIIQFKVSTLQQCFLFYFLYIDLSKTRLGLSKNDKKNKNIAVSAIIADHICISYLNYKQNKIHSLGQHFSFVNCYLYKYYLTNIFSI